MAKISKQIQHLKRLAERFEDEDLEGFSDCEALELILSFIIPSKYVHAMTKKMIKNFGGFRGVLDATQNDFELIGIEKKTVAMLRLIKEAGKFYSKKKIMGKDAIHSQNDVLEFLKMFLSGERSEKFLAIYLNTKNEVLGVEILHEGSIDQVCIYPRKAIEYAFKYNARGLIFAHNHPNGDPSPSRADRELTKVMIATALAVDIIVHDHIIIGMNSHFSGKEHGWMVDIPLKFSRFIEPSYRYLAETKNIRY